MWLGSCTIGDNATRASTLDSGELKGLCLLLQQYGSCVLRVVYQDTGIALFAKSLQALGVVDMRKPDAFSVMALQVTYQVDTGAL